MDPQPQRTVTSLGEALVVVADDRRMRTQLSRRLAVAGYAVTALKNFDAAAARIRSRRVDLLVTDVRLGDFNGFHLGIVARHIRHETRVVLISRRADAGLGGEAARLGLLYLVKPFTRDFLVEAVASWQPSPARGGGATVHPLNRFRRARRRVVARGRGSSRGHRIVRFPSPRS